ncbi:nitrate/nitrite transporter [Ramlibacter sp. WS9]|uniref:MFS transporter n=1 Tax=Ramlibacter sp. WS9 TaxID=1882741 RepID=UPI001141854C|nr:MFS transporter [Ramlibacter sp. WS9]ROZ63400.1 MFS transporter [Ramlibacter sp. WS9]
MLLILIGGFALSQAFRTAASIMAPALAKDFGLSPQQLGLFAAAFHFSFAGLQLFMGMAIDVYGPRRTIVTVFPLAVAGALVMAAAPSYPVLIFGQVLTGIGCGPAFLVCTVFIARSFEPGRFAAVNGAALGIGSVGLLLTGTPLAWIIEAASWRAGFVALAAIAAMAWLAIFVFVRDGHDTTAPRQQLNVLAALRGYGELFRLPHTLGIFALALTTYSSFMTLRGLWLGPLLIERHGFSLVQAGNVAIAISIVGMIGPPLFGRVDPGEEHRRRWIMTCALASAALFLVMAMNLGAAADVVLALVVSLLAGFGTLQYADVRSAYPPHMTGRAMAVFTMAMFLGVAVMQWVTGGVASAAHALGVETYGAVLGAIAVSLAMGAAAFKLLPAPTGKAAISSST